MAKGSKPKRQKLDFESGPEPPEQIVVEPTPPPKKRYGEYERTEIIRKPTSEILSGHCRHEWKSLPNLFLFMDGTREICRKCLNPGPRPNLTAEELGHIRVLKEISDEIEKGVRDRQKDFEERCKDVMKTIADEIASGTKDSVVRGFISFPA